MKKSKASKNKRVKKRAEIPLCPKCKSLQTIEIVYGMPSPEAQEEARKGKLALGGCLVESGNPNWHCKNCEHEWLVP